MKKILFISLFALCCSFVMILSFDDEEWSQMLQDPEFQALLNSTINEDPNNNLITFDIYYQLSSKLIPILSDDKKNNETLTFISSVLKKFDKDEPWNFQNCFAIYEKFQQWLQEGIWYSLYHKFSKCERLSSEDTKLLSLLKKILAYDKLMNKVIDPQPTTMMELSSSSEDALQVVNNLIANTAEDIFVFYDQEPKPLHRSDLTIESIPQKYKNAGSNLAQLLPKKKVAHPNELPLHDFISVVLCGFDTNTWEEWSKKFMLQRRFNDWIRLGTWKTLHDTLNESSSSNNNDTAWELPILKKILNYKKFFSRRGHNIESASNLGLEFPSFPSSHATTSIFTRQEIREDYQDFGTLVPHSSGQELLFFEQESGNNQQSLMPLRASTDTSIRYSQLPSPTIDLPPNDTLTSMIDEQSLLEFLEKELEASTAQSTDTPSIEINAVPPEYKYWGEELAKLAQLRKTSLKKMSASDFISIVLWKFDTNTWIGQHKPALLAKRFERWTDDGTWEKIYNGLKEKPSSSNNNIGWTLSLLKKIVNYKEHNLTSSDDSMGQAPNLDVEFTSFISTQMTALTEDLARVEEESLIEFLVRELEESTKQSVPTQMTTSVGIQTETPPLTYDLASTNINAPLDTTLMTPLPRFTNESTQQPLFQFHEQEHDKLSNKQPEEPSDVPERYKALGEKLAQSVPKRNTSGKHMKESVFISIVLCKLDANDWRGLSKGLKDRFKTWAKNGYWGMIEKAALRKKTIDSSAHDFVSESDWSLVEKIIKKKNELTKSNFKIQRAASFESAQPKFVLMRPPSIFSNQTVQTDQAAQADSQKLLNTILLPDSSEREPLYLAMPEESITIDIKKHKVLAEQLMAVVKILQSEATSAAKSRIDFISHILWKFDEGKSIRWEIIPGGTKLYRTFCEWHKNKTEQRKITWNEIYEQFDAHVTNDEHSATEDEKKILLLLEDIKNFHQRKPMDG